MGPLFLNIPKQTAWTAIYNKTNMQTFQNVLPVRFKWVQIGINAGIRLNILEKLYVIFGTAIDRRAAIMP